jgi:hypothetical protein
LVRSTGDTSPVWVVRVSNCRRFFNLDAFGLSPLGSDHFRAECSLGAIGRRVRKRNNSNTEDSMIHANALVMQDRRPFWCADQAALSGQHMTPSRRLNREYGALAIVLVFSILTHSA